MEMMGKAPDGLNLHIHWALVLSLDVEIVQSKTERPSISDYFVFE